MVLRTRGLTGSAPGAATRPTRFKQTCLKEETRQLNVALPVELHQRLKVAAVQEGISVREWTARAVLYYFANAGA